MEWTGKLANVAKDWSTNQFHITFTVNEESAINAINDIKGCEKLSIKAAKYRKKRSLDANAYCWVIISKIAEIVRSSKEEVYEEMLQKYGYFYQDEDGYISITVKAGVDMGKITGHWKFLKSNGKFSSYLMIKGSSEYDTKEMSHFIDCIVEEAKALGIETMPPEEIQRLMERWETRNLSL